MLSENYTFPALAKIICIIYLINLNRMQSVKTFQINLDSSTKEITVIGEIHLYSGKESKLAEELIKENNFDAAFLEKAPLGRITRFFHRALFKLVEILTLRYKKSLMEMVFGKGIPKYNLEKGTKFPLSHSIRFNLSVFLLFVGLTTLIALQNWRALFGFIIFLNALIQIKTSKRLIQIKTSKRFPKIIRYALDNLAPVNKEERDKTMSNNLISYISRIDFRRGVVIVGDNHFPTIVNAIEDAFGVKAKQATPGKPAIYVE